MDAASLTSDHVNYLIWRYLQERGYGKTAVQLMREWGTENPQELPFAQGVKRSTLICMLQDAREYDLIEATARQESEDEPAPEQVFEEQGATYDQRRKYDFMLMKKRPAGESVEGLERSDARHRGGLSIARKRPRLQVNGLERPLQPLSQSARSSDAKQPAARSPDVNGDSMELDAGESPPGARDEQPEDHEGHMEVDAEPAPLQTTLSIGESKDVQADALKDRPLARAIFDETIPTADIIQTDWTPPEAGAEPNLLLTGGSVFRLYSSADASWHSSKPTDLGIPDGMFFVAASAVSPDGRYTAAAFEHHDHGTFEVFLTNLHNLNALQNWEEDALGGDELDIAALRWSLDSLLLAVVCHSAAPTVKIWSSATLLSAGEVRPPGPVLGLAWTRDSALVLCGEEFLQVSDKIDGKLAEPARRLSTPYTWEMARHDRVADLVACASVKDARLMLFTPKALDSPLESAIEYEITSIEWRPSPDPDAPTAALRTPLLASSSTDGSLRLYTAVGSLTLVQVLSMRQVSPVTALAWSPDGNLLAAAGDRSLSIWAEGKETELGRLAPEPHAVWRPGVAPDGDPQSDTDMHDIDRKPSRDDESDVAFGPYTTLCWHPAGGKIAYAQGDKITLIEVER